jgi:uroporphyrinogen-III synthase
MHILITRPEPDASAWRTKFEARGITASVDPLLQIEFLPPAHLDLEAVQALIATSRNGLRGLAQSPDLKRAITLPLYTVGPGTAELARELGFMTIRTGSAAARDLVDIIAATAPVDGGALVHLTGDKLAFDLAAALATHGHEVRRLVVYRSRPAGRLQEHTIEALRTGSIDTVMLMSPLSAKTFLSLGRDAHLLEPYQQLVYVCLSHNIKQLVADMIPECAPQNIHVAGMPNSDAMFTLIERLAAPPK